MTVRPVRPVILLVVVSTKGGGISPSVDAQSDGESDQFDDELEIRWTVTLGDEDDGESDEDDGESDEDYNFDISLDLRTIFNFSICG